MAAYIPVDPSKRLGQQLRRFVDMQRESLDLGNRLKAIMLTQIEAGDDFTSVVAQFGIAANDAKTVFQLLTDDLAAVDVSAVRDLLDRMG